MEQTSSGLVLISATRLDELLELSRAAVERLPENDPLASALRGAVAEVRLSAIIEP